MRQSRGIAHLEIRELAGRSLLGLFDLRGGWINPRD